MADVYNFIVPTGVIVPDTASIQDQVIAEYLSVFGDDLITTPNTPQGLLIVAEVIARSALANNNATLANQINPNLAGGIFLDAIMALTGSQRTVASHSLVTCNLTGVPGTVIAAGSTAKETVHNAIFESLNSVTLAIDGTGTVDFQAVDTGPITAAANTLTSIVSGPLGWETITNPLAAVLGAATQSDSAAKQFRRNTLALQGMGLAEAITSGLYATPGVMSLKFRENIAPTTQVIDGVTMVGHSIYLCVDGGADIDVANTLVAKKNGGPAYNNGPGIPVSQSVTNPFSGQIMDILFDRPNTIQCLVQITVRAATSVQDPATAVRNAVLDYAAGVVPNIGGLGVGIPVSSFEIAGAVTQEVPGIYVQSVQTSLASIVDYSCAEIPIAIFEKAEILESSIVVILI